ncbi:hypothetical protein M9H77_12488 [Catharanthus roseus]|uniref:Uncharacterized protein n=1 Tax=Catharanthus roseus TaxID=4058 RepID=A0ACC0BHH4_CATRO|nr:hypothetical protein M9H77_12488 [Catharanthus roseus]
MMTMAETWGSLGSAMAGIMFVWAMYQNYFPYELRGLLKRYGKKLTSLIYPYIQITFYEYQGDGFDRSKVYMSIERYLDKNSSKQAKRLKATIVQDSESIVLSMQDHEEITDEFEGIKLWWASNKDIPTKQSISIFPREDDTKFFTLTFHQRYRKIITEKYLKHVLNEGKAIAVRERQRKLYTNNKNERWVGFRRRTMWSHVSFEHPSSFDTLAMDPQKKQQIIDDLMTFSKSKEYYSKIGKAWKRGYLLYGPPGTGKSSMIAAMANLLKYDVYDLELTAVKDNTELRKLLIEISPKSIVVIEDIDCSLDLTGQRENKKKEEKKEEEEKPDKEMKKMEESSNKESKVTLSGLLNFIDGLWSACGGERGRMDKHIELSYCGFEAFKVLAKNYLNIDSHHLFGTIGRLLEETNMTPADVAENLVPKSSEDDEEICLERLIKTIEMAKEEAARLKAEEEEKERLKKAEEEEKHRTEKEEKNNKENGGNFS